MRLQGNRPSCKHTDTRASVQDAPPCEHNVLVCGTIGRPRYSHPGLRHVCVPQESVSEWNQLLVLLKRHSPSLVVFTRASLEQLVESTSLPDPLLPASSHAKTILLGLSPKDAELIRLVAKGLRNCEIEHATGMKARTVRAHLSDLFRQFDVTNRTELIGALIEN